MSELAKQSFPFFAVVSALCLLAGAVLHSHPTLQCQFDHDTMKGVLSQNAIHHVIFTNIFKLQNIINIVPATALI